jgi:iron(III) transport system substrate-binding protein
MRFALAVGAALALLAVGAPVGAQEVTVLCNFEVDWCEALKTTYEKTTGQKAVFIRRTDGESLAQIRAERNNPRADVYHAAESASAKQLASEGLLEAYKSPHVAELHDWAQRIAEENKYFQTPIYTGVLGWGYNTELLAKKKMPEPRCWKDLVNPAYKDEIQMANPGTSGTAFNTVSTILQLMGEDEGFKFLAAMNKNVNQYTRSGSAGIRAPPRARRRSESRSCTIPSRRRCRVIRSRRSRRVKARVTRSSRRRSSRTARIPTVRASGWISCSRPPDRTLRSPSENSRFRRTRTRRSIRWRRSLGGEALIKLDLDKYGSKEGRDRLLSRWENEVFKAPK